MSFLDKFKATATKVGTQATAFGHTVAREAQTGSQKALTNFKLENEVRSRPPVLCGECVRTRAKDHGRGR